MKTSQLIIKAEEKQISAVQLNSAATTPNGELALVSLDIMKELLHAHATSISLREMKEQIVKRIEECDNIEEYKRILSYDLSVLELHANLKEYDRVKFEENKAKLEAKKKGDIFSSNSIDDMVNRGQ